MYLIIWLGETHNNTNTKRGGRQMREMKEKRGEEVKKWGIRERSKRKEQEKERKKEKKIKEEEEKGDDDEEE